MNRDRNDDSPGANRPEDTGAEDAQRADAPDAPPPRRPFTLADAIGRLDRGDHLRGGSTTAPLEQARLTVAQFVADHLQDPEAVLGAVLLRRLRGDEPLLSRHLERPLDALATFLSQVLASVQRLDEVTRDADAEWGRRFDERPYFDRPGQPAHPDDPYPRASVRERLAGLLQRCREAGGRVAASP